MEKTDSHCLNFHGIAYRLNRDLDRYEFVRLRCKQWSCGFCAMKNARHWRYHLNQEFAKLPQSYQWDFITITAPSSAHKTKDTFSVVNNVWRKYTEFYRRVWRKFGLNSMLEYVRVYEAHKKGGIHIHAIVASEISLNRSFWHSDEAKNCLRSTAIKKYQKSRKKGVSAHIRQKDLVAVLGGGYQFESKPIKSEIPLVVSYITNYMTKEIMSLPVPKGTRRIATSQGIARINETPFSDETGSWAFGEGWHYEQQIYAESTNRKVFDLTRKTQVTLLDFETSSILL